MRHLCDIVSKQHPLKMPKAAKVSDACQRMQDTHVGSVLVLDDEDHLCGIFTSRDLTNRVINKHKDADSTSLAEVMTANPLCMTPDDCAIEALRLMWDGGIHHMPVVEGERILGVVARPDFVGEENSQLLDERDMWEHMR